jgi:hypothetical protein
MRSCGFAESDEMRGRDPRKALSQEEQARIRRIRRIGEGIARPGECGAF